MAHDSPWQVIDTDRLTLRRFTADDAPFVFALFNDPSFIRFIGDRGVRDSAGARAYIEERFIDAYGTSGIGPFVVVLKATRVSIGFCSLFRRDWLDDVDLGFAFLPPWRRHGYAYEAADALLDYARSALGLQRLVAFSNLDNDASTRLLGRLGFAPAGLIRPPGEAADVQFFSAQL